MPDRVTEETSLTNRLLALMEHLGLPAAHFATQMPGDLAGLAEAHPDRIAGLVLCVPTRLDPAPFEKVAARLLMIAGETGITREATARAAARLAGCSAVILPGYDAPGWADVAADRTDSIVEILSGHLQASKPELRAATPRSGIAASGTHAGLTYRIDGQGPSLLLLPFFLAPSQWDPVVERLARQFSVIRLGGAHVGGVAALEDRARTPSYRAMFRTLIDIMAPRPGDRILDVGCGSGALDRLLAKRLGTANPLVAVDVNAFLLREAAALATSERVAGLIEFGAGSAEALPFADASFDCLFSVTVLEECDADRALREMHRVLRPGGRIGIVVRAIDLPQWWSLDLPESIRVKASVPPQSVGAGGVADKSLYRRLLQAGFSNLAPFPTLITLDRPDGPIWRYREDHVLPQLSASELAQWQTARAAAKSAGLLHQAHAVHCAVATKP